MPESIEMKRKTVLFTEKNNEKIQRFRTEIINETKDNISYAEAVNWLLNFGASDWFRESNDDIRARFYKIWVKSKRHRNYERTIDEFDFYEFLNKKRDENEVNTI